jgi:hypothetical protein
MTKLNRLFAVVCVLSIFGLASGKAFATSVQTLTRGPGNNPETTFNLLSFGAKPSDRNLNSRHAFQLALAALERRGRGTLYIPRGEYYIGFPDIATDIDPRNPLNAHVLQEKRLTREKLIIVPANVLLRGDTDEAGNPVTRIHWKRTSSPVFAFVNSDESGMRNLAFVFDGVQPRFFPWSQEDFLAAVGVDARWLGGPYEISTVIYTIGSARLRFENLSFSSGKSPADNAHAFAFGIVSKGKTPIRPDRNAVASLPIGGKAPGGGLSGCVTGNIYRSLKFSSFIMGILASGQCSPSFENISGNYRGSWFQSFDPAHEPGGKIVNIGPPGHLIYLTFQTADDVVRTAAHPEGERLFHSTTRSSDIIMRNITEGAETLANYNSLGTLALKNIDGGTVEHIESHHPAGLIQALVDVHNLKLQNLTWISERNLCSEPESTLNCDPYTVDLEAGNLNRSLETSDRLIFRDVMLRSLRSPALFHIAAATPGPLSNHILFDGLKIECTPIQLNKRGRTGIITVRAADTSFKNVTYIPTFPTRASVSDSDYASVIESGSINSTIDISIRRISEAVAADAAIYKCLVSEHAPNQGPFGVSNHCSIARRFVN